MRRTLPVFIVSGLWLGLLVTSCSSEPSGPGTGTGDPTDNPPGTTDPAPTNPSNPADPGPGGGIATRPGTNLPSGPLVRPESNVLEVVRVGTGDFTIEPFSERTVCAYHTIERKEAMNVVRYVARMPEGSHHFNMYFADPNHVAAPDGQGPCQEVLRSYLAGSQWPELDESFPPGFALKVPGEVTLILESHYVNASPEELLGRVDVELHLGKPETIHTYMGVYFNYMTDFSVQPREQKRVTATCELSPNTNLVVLTTHMHRIGMRADVEIESASGDRRLVYTSDDWEHPSVMKLFDQPIAIADGDRMRWSCDYMNTNDFVVTDGSSATRHEMCVAVAYYYPLDEGRFPFCLVPAEQ